MQTTNPMPGQLQGFLRSTAEIPAGGITYATYMPVTSPAITQMTGIALDGAGDIFIHRAWSSSECSYR